MKTIHRFPLEGRDPRGFVLSLPAQAQILHVGLRPSDGIPSVWVLFSLEAPVVNRLFVIIGTGWNIDKDPGRYVGTFMVGPMVWHLFESVL